MMVEFLPMCLCRAPPPPLAAWFIRHIARCSSSLSTLPTCSVGRPSGPPGPRSRRIEEISKQEKSWGREGMKGRRRRVKWGEGTGGGRGVRERGSGLGG